jgi:hypothetical protein
MAKLLDTERQFRKMSRRVGIYDTLEKCFATSSRSKDEAVRNAHLKRDLKTAVEQGDVAKVKQLTLADFTAPSTEAIANAPNAIANAPNAIVNAPNAIVNAPNAITNAADAIANAGDAIVNAADAIANAPNAIANAADAIANAPDAIANAANTHTDVTDTTKSDNKAKAWGNRKFNKKQTKL